jgi:hypothetical protein
MASVRQAKAMTCMRAVQISRFGGPEVLEVVDVPEPERVRVSRCTTSRPPS